MRRGETASGHLLATAAEPCHFDILPTRAKLNQLTEAAIKQLGLRTLRKIDRNNRWKMAGPFAFHEVLVVARRNNMPALHVCFIDPILIEQHLVFAPAAKT